MRPELELIEKIEQYIQGKLSLEDKTAFENQIAGNPGLQEEIQLQRDLAKGIERAALKQKIRSARMKYRLRKNLGRFGLGILIAAIMFFGAVFYFHHIKTNHEFETGSDSASEYNELGENVWADADRNISSQVFLLDGLRDTIIETRAGIVMAIPAHCFLDENGKPVEGGIQLSIKEALDAATIMRAGLSTRAGDDLLETGGMFYLDPRKDARPLKIDPSNSVYMEIPTGEVKPGMQLFKGIRKPGGSIDWVDPQALEHDLLPVAIQSLNFYPPGYLDSLQRWGYNIQDKKFTDSLYYSFAEFFGKTIEIAEPARESDIVVVSDSLPSRQLDIAADTSTGSFGWFDTNPCGVNPASIKTIWSEKFGNTFISTREFEERLKWIHMTADPTILDLYITNLNKPLYIVDSMAASKMTGIYKTQFSAFSARHDGTVKGGSKQFQELSKYYYNKSKAFTETIAKTQREIRNRQSRLDDEAAGRKYQHKRDSIDRVTQNFSEEFALNLKEAYHQLGYDTAIRPIVNTSVYRVQVTNTGWHNVDKYVYESTTNRSSLDYTDPATGKKAEIKYSPVSVQIAQWNEYDRIYVYLLPDRLSSFMRVNGDQGIYSEKLDELIKYDLVCIAYKNEEAYFYSVNSIKPKEYTGIILQSVSNDHLTQKLNSFNKLSQTNAILKEDDYFRFEEADRKRQKQNRVLEELRVRVLPVVFPCYNLSR
jgi:hypothetical protein